MSKPTSPTYRTTNWRSCNAALKRRGSLQIWFDPATVWLAEPSGKRGRSATFTDAAVQACLNVRERMDMATGPSDGPTQHEWTIRPFRSDDAGPLSRIYRAAVQTLAARHYAPDQIAAWLSIAPKPRDIAAIYRAGYTGLVCEMDGWPIGFSDHDTKGHIRFLYCHPDRARRGVAGGLLEAVETSARNARISSLTSEASEAALPVFIRHGFRTFERRDFAIDGVAIHNYAVAKRPLAISPTAPPGDPSK